MPLNLSAVSSFAGRPASAPRAESKPAQSGPAVRKTDGAELTGRALVEAAAQDTSVLTLDDARTAAKAASERIVSQAGVAVLAQGNQGSRLALGLLG
jgi:hypothetical protein